MTPAGPASFAIVALGGGMGAALRHAVNLALAGAAWPLATFVANISGCLAFGVLAGVAVGRLSDPWRLLLITGLLGGYTTFSTFGGEAVAMLKERPMAAAGYITASVTFGLLAVAVGERIGRALPGAA